MPIFSRLSKRHASWLPLIGFSSVATIAALGLARSGDAPDFAGRARTAPVLVLPGLTGDSVAVPGPEYPVLVNFWASWCAPCLAEHPLLMDMAARGVSIVGIAYKDSPGDAADVLRGLGDPFARVGLDETGDAGLAYGVAGVPETFIIDNNGTIILVHRGPLDRQSVARIEALLGGSTSAQRSDSLP